MVNDLKAEMMFISERRVELLRISECLSDGLVMLERVLSALEEAPRGSRYSNSLRFLEFIDDAKRCNIKMRELIDEIDELDSYLSKEIKILQEYEDSNRPQLVP